MIIIKVEKNNIEKALKIYKSKVIQTRQMSELNNRKNFEKKSVKRRNQILNAEFFQQSKHNSD